MRIKKFVQSKMCQLFGHSFDHLDSLAIRVAARDYPHGKIPPIHCLRCGEEFDCNEHETAQKLAKKMGHTLRTE